MITIVDHRLDNIHALIVRHRAPQE